MWSSTVALLVLSLSALDPVCTKRTVQDSNVQTDSQGKSIQRHRDEEWLTSNVQAIEEALGRKFFKVVDADNSGSMYFAEWRKWFKDSMTVSDELQKMLMDTYHEMNVKKDYVDEEDFITWFMAKHSTWTEDNPVTNGDVFFGHKEIAEAFFKAYGKGGMLDELFGDSDKIYFNQLFQYLRKLKKLDKAVGLSASSKVSDEENLKWRGWWKELDNEGMDSPERAELPLDQRSGYLDRAQAIKAFEMYEADKEKEENGNSLIESHMTSNVQAIEEALGRQFFKVVDADNSGSMYFAEWRKWFKDSMTVSDELQKMLMDTYHEMNVKKDYVDEDDFITWFMAKHSTWTDDNPVTNGDVFFGHKEIAEAFFKAYGKGGMLDELFGDSDKIYFNQLFQYLRKLKKLDKAVGLSASSKVSDEENLKWRGWWKELDNEGMDSPERAELPLDQRSGYLDRAQAIKAFEMYEADKAA